MSGVLGGRGRAGARTSLLGAAGVGSLVAGARLRGGRRAGAAARAAGGAATAVLGALVRVRLGGSGLLGRGVGGGDAGVTGLLLGGLTRGSRGPRGGGRLRPVGGGLLA